MTTTSRHYDPDRALHLLRLGCQDATATFRDDQEPAIRHLVEGRGRLLVVQKTGWGKSSVYFIATRLLREQGAGPALLISPLLALMRNQISAAGRMGVRALTMHSENTADWATVTAQVVRHEVDILLVSPERLGSDAFRETVLSVIAPSLSLLVIDEAHCISDWGHDFRPHYRLLERLVRRLPANVRLLATTATANDRVMADLREVFGSTLTVQRGDLHRPSLTLQTLRLPGQIERLAWLAERLGELDGSGIVYALTVRDAEQVAAWLRSQGLAVEAYTGQTPDLRRIELEHALQHNEVKALVATSALGMGYDKPDLAFVIHYQMPGSVVHYYQQVGRAGRGLAAAHGVLLSGVEDDTITDWFIRTAFPTPDEVRQVLSVLDAAHGGCTQRELESAVNLPSGRIQQTLLLLELESPAPIVRNGSRWQLTSADLSTTFWQRAERLTALRRDEQRQMQDYVRLSFGDHMAFLIAALDGDPTHVTAPTLPALPTAVDPHLIADATRFLRRFSLPLEPRRQWPPGGLPGFGLTGGRIPVDRQAHPGRALCVWGDAGWGDWVARGKYREHRFADALVQACADLLDHWRPDPFPAWVTCIPSWHHADLVPDFARRLAQALGLPFRMALEKTAARPSQKNMANTVQQARNLDGALAPCVADGPWPSGPVLLVDDMVDSRWTLTLAAWLLRDNGVSDVWPLALAQTTPDT